MSPATLQDNPSVESFFNVVETETMSLFEHVCFKFLAEFDHLGKPSERWHNARRRPFIG
jgi:hypothetical protein